MARGYVVIEVTHLINPSNRRGETLHQLLEDLSPCIAQPVEGPRSYAKVRIWEAHIDIVTKLIQGLRRTRSKSQRVQLKILERSWLGLTALRAGAALAGRARSASVDEGAWTGGGSRLHRGSARSVARRGETGVRAGSTDPYSMFLYRIVARAQIAACVEADAARSIIQFVNACRNCCLRPKCRSSQSYKVIQLFIHRPARCARASARGGLYSERAGQSRRHFGTLSAGAAECVSFVRLLSNPSAPSFLPPLLLLIGVALLPPPSPPSSLRLPVLGGHLACFWHCVNELPSMPWAP
ncbi:unnamed protein product [Prorocentrum cordatum]|uniref:Uncharacterized protein n=1 Tax=Prorocentrum cordatum TaxID=2364126 RepID=A0ABN9WNN8_9DINO|nr:unnamed protein product [Polarella glacialis]